MSKRALIIVAIVGVAASVVGSASAYFLSSGAGKASAQVGMLSAPGTPAVPATSTGTVSVNWTASSTSGGAVTPKGYYVTRTAGGTTSAACGSSSASLITTGTSCSDTSVPSGTYTYAVTAVYNSWSATSPNSNSVVVQTDTTSPTSAASTPQYASGSFTPSYTASDTGGSGLESIQLYAKGPSDSGYGAVGSAVSLSGDSASGNFPAYSPSEGNGRYSFYTVATDNAGNTQATPGSAQSTTLEDSVAPSSAISFPASGGRYDSAGWTAGCNMPPFSVTDSICGTASDATSGVKQVQVSVQQGSGNYWNGASFGSSTEQRFTATGTTTWTLSFPSSSFLTDGTYTVRVYAADNAGNAQGTATSTTFVIDTTAPSVTLTQANGSAVTFPYSSTAAVTSLGGACGTATGDSSTVSWSITGGSTQSGNAACSSGSWSATLPSSLGAGSYTLTATQSDAAGNTGSSGSKSVTVTTSVSATVLGSNNGVSPNPAPCTSLTTLSCIGPSVTTKSGATELIFITDKGSQTAGANPSSVTCSCFSGSGGAATAVSVSGTNAFASYDNPNKNEISVFKATGAGGSAASVVVTMGSNEQTSDMVITVLELGGNSLSAPISELTVNASNTNSTTASTAAFSAAPASGDAELVFFGANRGVTMSIPSSPPSITRLIQTTDTTNGSAFGIYFTTSAQQAAISSILGGTGSPWGAIALEVGHS